jgi:eukaryotic-like serine/threonine-protein kinase
MIGEEIGGYTILETLGTGTMGTVYKAEDLSTHRVVAVKVVRAQVLYDREKRERFLQGLLAASELRHEKICPILEIGDEDDDFYVAMPFLKGTTLKQQIDRKRLSWEQALEIALEVGEALAVGHAGGAVHRGFKPANVWLLTGGAVLVTDFSMARFTEIDRKTSSKLKIDFADTVIPMAALAYMSPEQIRGDPVDYRTDIFSFGVVLYEMLSGHHPFESRNSLSRMSAILNENPSLVSAREGPFQLSWILFSTRCSPSFRRIVTRALTNCCRSCDEFVSTVPPLTLNPPILRAVLRNSLRHTRPTPCWQHL